MLRGRPKEMILHQDRTSPRWCSLDAELGYSSVGKLLGDSIADCYGRETPASGRLSSQDLSSGCLKKDVAVSAQIPNFDSSDSLHCPKSNWADEELHGCSKKKTPNRAERSVSR